MYFGVCERRPVATPRPDKYVKNGTTDMGFVSPPAGERVWIGDHEDLELRSDLALMRCGRYATRP